MCYHQPIQHIIEEHKFSESKSIVKVSYYSKLFLSQAKKNLFFSAKLKEPVPLKLSNPVGSKDRIQNRL